MNSFQFYCCGLLVVCFMGPLLNCFCCVEIYKTFQDYLPLSLCFYTTLILTFNQVFCRIMDDFRFFLIFFIYWYWSPIFAFQKYYKKDFFWKNSIKNCIKLISSDWIHSHCYKRFYFKLMLLFLQIILKKCIFISLLVLWTLSVRFRVGFGVGVTIFLNMIEH